MKILKIILILIGSIFVLLVVLFAVYLLINRQGVVEPYDLGKPELGKRLLIASQGSGFKNALVESVTTYLAEESRYVRVMDVTGLAEVDESEWDAILIVHTTEQWKLQPDVKKYLDRADALDKVIVVTTSGSGEWKSEDYAVDVMTSASKSEELPLLTQNIVASLKEILQ
ncbi:MAG: hypothetical protein JSV53_06850 [candidate division WOR-3 bacterium]|nr:MAG: hypothetical protein JSV53_06850 [candidate division WOR-3 bacterium]